ncbi:MAG: T9SS type A sorting domain-containing protein, partial [Cyclonatronaceae bacterium]
VASGSSSHTRNAAAVSRAMMHVLPSGEAFQLYAPGTPVSAPAPSGQHPQGFELRRAYPNPFNPETSVEIRAESAMQAEIEVFNILGQKVYSRPAFALRSGVNRLGLDLRGESSGVYLLRVSAGGGQQSLRITLMK